MSKFSKALLSLMLAAGVMTSMVAVHADDLVTSTAPEEEAAAEEVVYAEAPKFSGYALAQFDFNDDEAVPTALNGIEGLAIVDGCLTGTSTGGDPYAYLTDANINAADVDYVIVRIAADTEAAGGEIFFSANGSGIIGGNSMNYYFPELTDAEGFYNCVIEAKDFPATFTGTIGQIRIDPLTAAGEFKVDSITFWTTDTQVAKVNFSEYTKANFGFSGGISRAVVHDGFVMVMSNGNDPFFNLSGLSINADAVETITFRIKARYEDNTNAQMFFTTETIGWSEAASFRFDLSTFPVDEDGFYNVTINTADCAEWKGTTTGIRLDPSNGKGTFIVDSFYFNAPEYVVTEEAVEEVEEIVDAEEVTAIDFIKLYSLGYFL